MPDAARILEQLTATANDWLPLAVLWHPYFAALLLAIFFGRNASRRLVALLMLPPLVSVSALAWMGDNAFNGMMFALLVAWLLGAALRLPRNNIVLASMPWRVAGGLLFVYGWVYPHFVEAETIAVYLYAAPAGLVPCPTLALVTGISLIVSGLDSRLWSVGVAAAGLFYGLVGTLYLDVALDWVLVAGSVLLLAAAFTRKPSAV